MAIPPRLSFILLLFVSAIVLSCNGTQLSRTKRTVELIEGAKDFILRMAEINATPGRLVWVQINDENYKGYATEEVFIPEEREAFTLKPKKEKAEATTAKQTITITKAQTEKSFEKVTLTPPPPPPPITDFYPPAKPSSYENKVTTEAPAPKAPAPQDKKKGLLTSLFSLIFPANPKKKEKKEKKKTETTTTETVTEFIPDETTTTERTYLPPPPSPTKAASTTTPRATTARPAAPTTAAPTTAAPTTTVAPVPVHVHHIIQPVHIPQRIPIPQPVHVHQPVQVHQPAVQVSHVHQPVHLPVSHHVPQSPIQLVGIQPFSLPACTSSPVSTFQRCLPASARLPLSQATIAQVPVNAGFVRLPRNINQLALQQQHLPVVDYRDGVEDEVGLQ